MIGRGGRFGSSVNNAGTNVANGITIPIYIKNIDDSTKYQVTILDAKKSIIKTFTKDSKEDKVDFNTGMNNFVWDMNYSAAEKIPEGYIVWNGNLSAPKAAPGNYFAKVKVGNDSSELAFTILAEPQYQVSQSEYEQQLQTQIKIRDKFSEIINHLKYIKDLRNQLNNYKDLLGKSYPKEVKTLSDSIIKKITTIEEALHQTKAKSGQDVLNFPIRLDDKLSALYNQAAAGRGTPNKQVLEVFEVLAAQIDAQTASWKSVLDNEVKSLNNLIHEKQLPVFGVNEK